MSDTLPAVTAWKCEPDAMRKALLPAQSKARLPLRAPSWCAHRAAKRLMHSRWIHSDAAVAGLLNSCTMPASDGKNCGASLPPAFPLWHVLVGTKISTAAQSWAHGL